MKIAYLAQSVIPSRTANSIHVMRMCRAFVAQAHEVTLVVPANRQREPDIKDPFAYYGVPAVFDIKYVASKQISGKEILYGISAAIAAYKLGVRLVYSRDLLGAFTAARFGLPVVFESHQPFSRNRKGRMFLRLALDKNCKRIVVISDILRQMIAEEFPEISHKLFVAHDGADPVVSDHGEPATARLQVGYVGHLYPGRGVEVIIAIAEACPWADFHMVGGEVSDVNYWQAKNPPENIKFHGFVPPAETSLWRGRCNVLLAPYQEHVIVPGGMDTSRFMSPLKLFEYMAAGRAIICSDLPVLREVLEHNRTAVLCKSDDVAAWVAALQKFRDDGGFRKAIGAAAKKTFDLHYSWQARAAEVLRAI